MAVSTRTLLFIVVGVSLAICFFPTVKGLVFGLDFGSRWIKMSVIRGNTFEIILDAQTKRKFLSGIAFHDDERFFAADAEKVMPRSPQHTYHYLSQLLGKLANSTLVEELKPHLLYADAIEPHPERGTVSVRYDQNTTFAVEDLTGMIFNFARETAINYVDSAVSDVVITVPPHFTTEERAAVIDAAELGGFHVLSLINDGTAIALHYAFGKRFEEPKNVIFYDMGHSNTRATLVEYHSIIVKKGAKNMTQPTMKVKAVAYDTRLGGRDFDYRLAEHLAGVAVEQMAAKGIKSSVEAIKANKKSWSRLLTAASQAKTVLSANAETYAAVEGLVDSYDLKTSVTRAQFEEICADLFARVSKPIEEALALANLTMADVASVELAGGGVRVPKVQTTLKETLGLTDLSKTINGDEAAVLGAVFYAAHLSTSIKVPEHKIKDITPYGVSATLRITRPADSADANGDEEEIDEGDLNLEGDESGEEDSNTVTKVLSLFKPFGRVGAKKNVSFRKRVSNFTVELAYDEVAHLPTDVPRQLARYTVDDMSKLDKFNYTGNPKMTLSFRLSTSGVVELEKVEAEVVVIKYPEPEPEVTATPSPSPSADEPAETTESEEAAEEAESDKANEESESQKDDEDAAAATAEEEEKQKEEEQEQEEKKEKKKEQPAKKRAEKKPRKSVHKVVLSPRFEKLGISERSYVEKARARSLLRQWDAKAISKREKAEAKNDLETFIYDTKEKLWDEELEKVSTEEQRDAAREALSAAAEWLEDEGADVSTQEYRDKMNELVDLTKPIFERKEELTKRPVQVAMLSFSLNNSRSLLTGITERLRVEEEEVEEVLDLIEETQDWLNTKVKEQDAKQPHEEPAFKSEQVQAKAETIERMVRKLLRRKPRATPTPVTIKTASTSEESGEAAEEPTTSSNTEQQQQDEEEVILGNGADVNLEEAAGSEDIL